MNDLLIKRLLDGKHEASKVMAAVIDYELNGNSNSKKERAPLFALKACDIRERSFESNGTTILFKPGMEGAMTIDDLDMWLFLNALIMLSDKPNIDRTVQFPAVSDFTENGKRSNRNKSGVTLALTRILETTIIVKMKAGTEFSLCLIDSWRTTDFPDGKTNFEVTFPGWLPWFDDLICVAQ